MKDEEIANALLLAVDCALEEGWDPSTIRAEVERAIQTCKDDALP